MIFIALSVCAVSAEDVNSTDELAICDDAESGDGFELADASEKETPVITLNSSRVTSGDEVEIILKDSNNLGLANKSLTAIIKKEEHSLNTDDNGAAKLKLDLPANKYVLQVKFKGDEDYAAITKSFDITVFKISTVISLAKTSLTN